MAKKFTLLKRTIAASIIIGSLFQSKLQAQGWTKMDLSGLEMRSSEGSSQAAFSIDKAVFIIGGKQGSTVKATAFLYSPAHDNGFTLPDFDGGARYNALGFSVNGKGYIIGGIDASGTYKKDVWEYVTTGTWTKKADFPGGERAGLVAFVIDNKVYVGTGTNGSTFFNDLWEYTPTTDAWVQKSNFAGAARSEAIAFASNKKGYIGTGLNSSATATNDIWEYTPSTNSWVQKNNFPGDARASAAGFNMLEKGYIGTGNNGTTNYKDFWEYTSSSDSWKKLADYMGTERHDACGVAAGARACIFSGENASGVVQNTGYFYKHLYTYGFTVTPSVVCVGSKVVIKNTTTDPDAYSYRWEIFTNPPYNRTTILTDTIEYIPTKPDLASSIMLTVKEENGWLDLGHANRNLKVTNIDSVTLTVKADTCIGGVGTALARPYSDNAAPPYKYEWSNGITHDTAYYMNEIGSLKPGPITIKITDAGGCVASKSATVGSVTDIPRAVLVTIPDTCAGHVGEATAFPITDKLPYKFNWSNSKTTAAITGLATGKYVVTLTDKNGCISKDSIVVPLYKDTVKVSLTTIADTCIAKTGVIKSVAKGGRLPYSYSWSNASTTPVISGLVSGSYWVTVSDKNGCFVKDTAIVKAQHDSIKVVIASVDANCHASDGSLAATVSNGTAPYTYSWSNTATTSAIDHLPAGPFTLEVKDKYGCKATVNTLVKTSSVAIVPAICMVTVDSSSKYNVINWEKTNYTAVDSFIVYREVSTNSYKRIGAVPSTALSSFVDKERTKYFPNTGDPNAGTYRYKLQILDACGNYSALSPYHNTIFIVNNNGAFSWPQLYTIEGSVNPVNSYVLMRDDNATGNWNAINSVSGTQQLVTDPAYNAFKNTAAYRVQTLWNISCTPTFLNDQEQRASAFTASLSNIQGKVIVTSVDPVSKNNVSISLYPNPFNSEANLEITGLTGKSIVELKLFDHLGKQVLSQQLENGIQKLNRNGLSSGMYFLEIIEQGNVLGKQKVVIND